MKIIIAIGMLFLVGCDGEKANQEYEANRKREINELIKPCVEAGGVPILDKTQYIMVDCKLPVKVLMYSNERD